jgi:hypothetical protein
LRACKRQTRRVPAVQVSLHDGRKYKGQYALQSCMLTDNPLLAGGEDEIDWDEDDTKASNAPAAAAVAAGGQGQVANPTAVPNQKVDIDPSQTADLRCDSSRKFHYRKRSSR